MMLPDLSKLSPEQRLIYINTLKDYLRISKALNSPNCNDRELLTIHQVRLCRDLQVLHLTPEDKVNIYLEGRAYELPPDGAGKDEICGKLLPTQDEVDIGMYPDRNLYFYSPFTCGIFMFYSEDNKFRYLGSSQYIEYAVHSHFCRWRSERDPNTTRKHNFKGLLPVKYMLENHKDQLRFRIVERVPYSLLDTALRYNRAKYKCMWQYDLGRKNKFNPKDYESGKYNY